MTTHHTISYTTFTVDLFLPSFDLSLEKRKIRQIRRLIWWWGRSDWSNRSCSLTKWTRYKVHLIVYTIWSRPPSMQQQSVKLRIDELSPFLINRLNLRLKFLQRKKFYFVDQGGIFLSNVYWRRKWIRRLEFKFWTKLFAFNFALMPLEKA